MLMRGKPELLVIPPLMDRPRAEVLPTYLARWEGMETLAGIRFVVMW
jgi:hypothetical protein